MGLQLTTAVTIDGTTRARVVVHLDSNALQIGGRPRLEIALAQITKVSATAGVLALRTKTSTIEIELGDAADTWAAKIRAPPSRAKKLGLKPGLRVAMV